LELFQASSQHYRTDKHPEKKTLSNNCYFFSKNFTGFKGQLLAMSSGKSEPLAKSGYPYSEISKLNSKII
jgi:hypothetical protein